MNDGKKMELYKFSQTNIERYYFDIKNSENRMKKAMELADQNPCSCESLFDWLFEDYVEETLENADGLVTGQTILVREGISSYWQRAVFIGYYDGMFYAANELNDKDCYLFKQAKLP